jgi:hypothetical protein
MIHLCFGGEMYAFVSDHFASMVDKLVLKVL